MGKLILLRHGESVWNKKNVFTGWVDVPLSSNGISEALKAGEQLDEIEFDVVFTSLQVRAIETAMLVLSKNKNDKTFIIIHEQGRMKDKTEIHTQTMKNNT